MVEPITTTAITTVTVAYAIEKLGGKELLIKLLGPTFDLIGHGFSYYSEKGIKNLSRIFSKAEAKAINNLDDGAQVPPKVLKSIIQEGFFCEDELSSDYFAGILASSRSQFGKDDRGTYFSRLLSSLSNHQIHGHYLIYYTLRKCLIESKTVNYKKLVPKDEDERKKLREINKEEFEKMEKIDHQNWLLDIGNTDLKEISSIGIYFELNELKEILCRELENEKREPVFDHIINGLIREKLIEKHGAGGKDQNAHLLPDKEYIAISPSYSGIEFFLWAHGLGQGSFEVFRDPKIKIEPIEDIPINLKCLNMYKDLGLNTVFSF